MGWKHIGIITLALCVNVLAQQGYNYDRPEKPFSGTSGQTPGTFPRGPSGNNGYTPGGEQTNIPSRQYLEPITKPGYPKPSQTLTSPNPYSGNQGTSSQPSYPGSRPSAARTYEPGSSRSQQGQFGSSTPDYPSSKPSGPGPQFPTTSGYPNSRPFTNGYRGEGTSGSQSGYPTSKPSGPASKFSSTGSYPSSEPLTPAYNRAETPGSQFSSTPGYSGSKPSGPQSQFPTSEYPTSRPSTPDFNEAGTSGSQFPPTSGYPSSKSVGPGSQFSATPGYPSSRPSTLGYNDARTSGSQFPPTSDNPSSKLLSTPSGYPTSRPLAPGYNEQLLPSGSQGNNPQSETGSFAPKQYSENQQQFGQGPSDSRAPNLNGQFGSNQANQQFSGPQGQFNAPAGSNAPGFNGPLRHNQVGQLPGPQGSPRGQFGTPSFQQQYEDNSIDEGDYSAIPGEPGRDYSILSEVPETSFSCDGQEFPGYYADIETRCQAFHICANKKSYDFLCPNGTVFHQEHLVCVWWNQFDCESAPSLYSINAKIYEEGLRATEHSQFATPQQLGENAVRYPSENPQEFGTPKAGQGLQEGTGRGGKGSIGLPASRQSNNAYDQVSQAVSRPGQSQFSNGRPGGQGTQEYPSRPGQPTSQFENGGPGNQRPQGYPRTGQSTPQFGNEQPANQGSQGYPSLSGPSESSRFGQGSQSSQVYPRPGQSTPRFSNENPQSGPQGYPSGSDQASSRFGNEILGNQGLQGPQKYPRPSQSTSQLGNERPGNQGGQGYPSRAGQSTSQFGNREPGDVGSQGYPRPGQTTPQFDTEKSGNQESQGYPSSAPGLSTKFGHGQQGTQGSQEYSRPGQQPTEELGARKPSSYPGSNQPSAGYPTTRNQGQTLPPLSGQYPDHSKTGYPSGRPESALGQNPFGPTGSQQGPGRIQLGGNGQATQGQTGSANKPTREYLPPVTNT